MSLFGSIALPFCSSAISRGAFNLRLPLVAYETVPAALALAALPIIDDDGPAARRSLADMALHDCFFFLGCAASASSASGAGSTKPLCG